MKVINHNELKQVIKRAYLTKVSCFTWGKIGIGKSESILEISKEIAKEKKKKFIEWNKIDDEAKRELLKGCKDTFIFADIRSAELDPTDLKGLPNFFNGCVEWKSQILFKVLSNPKADGMIFFDEINLSPPSVLSALYKIILDRTIGELCLSEDVGIVAGGNSADDSSSVFDMPEPLRNRFIHVELGLPDIKDWSDWALENEINPDIVSFLNWRPARLYSFNKKNKDVSFSTPRMWVTCSKLIKDASFKEKEILISSSVGEGIALEFITFLKLQNKLDIDDLLKNPSKIKEITEIDQKYALLGALTDRYRKDLKILKPVIEICRNLEPEFSILLLRYFLNVFKSVKKSDNYISLFSKELLNVNGYDLIQKYSKYFN